MSEKLQNLEKLFKDEIGIYKNLAILETSKKEAILRSNAKLLESFTNQSSKQMNDLQVLEVERMKLVDEVIPNEKKSTDKVPSLSIFLDSLDKISLTKFKPLATDLKEVVSGLKEKISLNEQLLKSKLEIFSMSIDALKNAAEPTTSELYGDQGKSKVRTNIMLNMKA